MIYFLVTTCLIDNIPIRNEQYTLCISRLKQVIQNKGINNYKIIIIENNGNRNTFLNNLECDVFYTCNNGLPTNSIGYKELKDVTDCIERYSINDDDFVVKITGRYILNDESEFIDTVKNIDTTKYDCIIKYGWYRCPLSYKTKDCITGLIGMRAKFIKQIEFPNENECVEWKWATVTYLIDDDKIHIVDKLGIHICPGSINSYFFV
jgi:hypothetical protein